MRISTIVVAQCVKKNIKERKKRQDLTDFSNSLPLSGKRMNAERRKRIDKACDFLYEAYTVRLNNLGRAKELAQKAKEIIGDVKSDESDAFDNLPDSFQMGSRGEQMERNIDAMDDAMDEIDDLDFTKTNDEEMKQDVFQIIGEISDM